MVKKFLSVLLAVMMMFSIVPVTSIQAAAASGIDSAVALSLNSFNDAVINSGGGSVLYSYAPDADGKYVIYSTSDDDTVVSMYKLVVNEEKEELALVTSDDDSGDAYNFRLEYEMKKGETYFFEVKYGNGSSTGTIPFALGKTYTVTYKSMGGENLPESQIKDFGKDLVLTINEPTHELYGFYGWSTSVDASTVDYLPGSVYSEDANITLYAVWGAIDPNIYTGVDLTLNATTEAVIDQADTLKYFKYTATKSGKYVIYSKTNVNVCVDVYDNDGILVQNSSENAVAGSGNFYQSFVMGAGETYYFAVGYNDETRIGTIPFILGETYTVSYDVNGGTTAPAPQLKVYDIPLLLETPTRVGYMFAGWAINAGSTDVVYKTGSYYTANEDITLYAVWEEAIVLDLNSNNNAEIITQNTSQLYSYTPAVDGMYVIYSNSAVDTQVILYGDDGIQIAENDNMSDSDEVHYYGEYEEIRDKRFEKDFRLPCYMFAGKTYYFEVSFNAETEKTRVGTIPFTFGEAYTVSFDTTGGSTKPSPQIKDYGATLILNETVPTRVGYSFLGWATSENGPVVYTAGGDYAANESVTLYAVWEQGSDLTVNSTNNAVINNAGESKYFAFTPSESGKYVIYSTTDKDTCISLYDSKGELIESSDDAGEGFNMKLSCEMTARERYYFEIKYYDATQTGTIPFNFGKVYTVAYKVDGVDGVFATQEKEYGIDLTLDCELPTKEGCSLKGWSTSATSSTVAYAIGDTYTNEANVTLYAVWELNTYDVTYDANGGENAPAGQVKTHGTELTLSAEVPTREGYTFKGWATSANGAVAYAPGATYTAEEAVTLYAVWEINTYAVTYDANGGENAPAGQVKTYGIDLTLATEEPTRFGYTFLGWSTDATATTPEYVAGAVFAVNADTVLYAVWKQDDVLTVNSTNNAVINNVGESKVFTFTPNVTDVYVVYSTGDADTQVNLYDESGNLLSSNDDAVGSINFRMQYNMTAGQKYYIEVKYSDVAVTGTISFVFGEIYTVTYKENGGNNAPTSQIKDYAATLVLSETIPTREGYTFLGWATEPTATTATYVAGDDFTVDADTILYAVWELNTYDVTYDANGGENAPAGQVKTHGTELILSAEVPTREGYTFKGWATSANGAVAYAPGATYTAEEAVTLYAVWEINTYAVTYDANGGENAPAGLTNVYGTTVNVSSEVPVREGHTFLGWRTNTNETYVAGDSFTLKADTTLYAVWEINTFAVTYDANGGENAPAGQVKTYGIDLTLATEEPTRDGYTFVGWAINPNTTTVKYTAGGKYTANAEIVLYAVWRADTYTVKYDANGGKGAPESAVKAYDMGLSISGVEPTRDGYAFLGWATEPDATSATYSPWDIFIDNKDTTLYAVWEKDVVLGANSYNSMVITEADQSKYFTYTPTKDGIYVIYSTSDADTRVYLYNSVGVQIEDDDESGDGRNFRLQYNMTAGTTYRFKIKYNDANVTGTIPFVFGEVYEVSYDVNGGTGVVYSQSKDYGKELTLRTTKPTRKGYTFLGWSTSAGSKKPEYLAGDSLTTNEDTVLYAVWGKNGLEKHADGKWYYVEGGKVVTSKNGLVKHTDGKWYYVKSGVVDKSYTGLCKYNSKWYYVNKGVVDKSYTGLCKYNSKWYYVEDGVVDKSYTGLCKYNSKWYYVNKGVVDKSYTGLCKYNSKWYYVKKGVVDKSYTGNVKYNGKTYKVVKGVKV